MNHTKTLKMLRTIHEEIFGGILLDGLSESELIEKYHIEYVVLSKFFGSGTTIGKPQPCKSGHCNEKGVAFCFKDRKESMLFVYSNATGGIASKPYALSIYRYDPRVSFICTEIFYRTAKQNPANEWVKNRIDEIITRDGVQIGANLNAS